jgi:BASS family bile acid:Na+ symporter
MPPLADVLPWAIAMLLLVTVGLDLRVQDFAAVRQRPALVAAGVLVPPFVLPLVALALVHLIAPASSAARGVLLLSACPIGGVSTTYSLLARANPALSVTLTALSCVVALVTMPLILAALAAAGDVWQASQPRVLVQQVALVLIPPVALGMAIRARWPAWSARHLSKAVAAAFALAIVNLVLIIVATMERAASFDWSRATLIAFAFTVVAWTIGAGTARGLGASSADRFTIAAEFGTRNVAVGLAVALAMGVAADFAPLAAVYLMVEMPFMLTAAVVHRYRYAPSQ